MKKIYELNSFHRTILLWIAFMTLLWIVFGIGLITNPAAWKNVPPVERETGWRLLAFILVNNGLLLLLILIGNFFVRFGSVTPGLIILAYQAVAIGWTAGTNGFSEPFMSVASANAAFLRIGLWETTAYVFLCAVTLTKSLNVANSFPAKRWDRTNTLKEVSFSRSEIIIAAVGIIALVGAAWMEAF